MLSKARITLTLLALTIALTSTSQDLSSVIAHYLSASGGKEKIDQVKSMYNVRWTLRPKGDTTFLEEIECLPHFTYRKSWKHDPGFLTLITYANINGTLLFSEKFGHRQLTLQKRDVRSPSFLTQHRLLKLFEENKLTFRGEQSLEGKVYYAIQTEGPPNDHEVYYFDKTTGLLSATMFVGAVSSKISYHDEYREVHGIKVPFVSRTISKGDTTFVSAIKKLVINPPVDTTEFYPTIDELTRAGKNFQKVEILPESFGERSFEQLLAHFSGKRILIDIWATWCGPCKFEFGTYDDKFYDFLFDRKIEMLFISIDEKEKDSKWRNDIQQFNINGYHVRKEAGLMSSLYKTIFKNGAVAIPRYILIDESGNILNDSLPKPSNPEFKKAVGLALKDL